MMIEQRADAVTGVSADVHDRQPARTGRGRAGLSERFRSKSLAMRPGGHEKGEQREVAKRPR
jgi:hypothetical protein